MTIRSAWLAALLLALFVALPTPAVAQPAKRLNMVVMVADDLGRDDCAPYGNKGAKTPNLQRLADEGMRFERAFLTCSSCSPSRASILTGRYPHNTGAEQLHWPLPKEQVTFVELLKKAGYWTGAAGKWHLGDAAKDRFDYLKIDGTGPSGCEDWVSTLRARPKDKPFFAWLASVDPHRDYDAKTPKKHQPEDVVVPPYLPDNDETRDDLVRYYDEIARLDGFVGQVLDELQKQGVTDDTLVVFLSDNGRPFPRCKTTVYDSGIQTPLLIRAGKRVKAGSVCGRLVSSIDLAPTLLELAGVAAGPTFQGKSFAVLLKKPDAIVRDRAFAEHNWHDFEARGRAVRTERYKYIRNEYSDVPNTPPADAVRSPTFQEMRRLRDKGRLSEPQMALFEKVLPKEEMYDCVADPHEMNNIASDIDHIETLAKLREALDEWKIETEDRRPRERTPDEFDRETGKPLSPRKGPRLPPKE